VSDAADFGPLGLVVGHATDADGATGCTVVRGTEGPCRGAVAVLGRATGTRELHTLAPDHLVDRVDAILLTGGSAYGLDAAAGVMRWMEERGRGFPVGVGVVPIVPAAVLFDLAPCGRADARPGPAMAHAACEAARSSGIGEGSTGAGAGATVGKGSGPRAAMKGGVGCATVREGDLVAGAVAVVNAFGDVRDDRGAILAGARTPDGAFADTARLLARGLPPERFADAAARNTTLCVVALSAPLSRTALAGVAHAATAGLHRRITPAGTAFDGDVVFALSPHEGREAQPAQAEALATRALERAIERAVRLARGRDGIPGIADPGFAAPAQPGALA